MAHSRVSDPKRTRGAVTAVRRGGHGDLSHFPALTVSRSFFPTLNAGVFEAAMAMLSPVAGLIPDERSERGS